MERCGAKHVSTSSKKSILSEPFIPGKSKIKKRKHNEEQTDLEHAIGIAGFLSGVVLFILKAGSGLGRVRCDIFSKQVTTNGGKVVSEITPEITHILVDEDMTLERMCRILKLHDSRTIPDKVKVVKASWLAETLSEKILVDTSEYELNVWEYLTRIKRCKDVNSTLMKQNTEFSQCEVDDANFNAAPATGSKWMKDASTVAPDSDDSSYVPSDDDYQETIGHTVVVAGSSSSVTPDTSPSKLPSGDWVCSRSSTSHPTNVNKHITDKLEVLRRAYENTKDKWRAFGYRKAINALEKHPTEVTSWEEASHIPGIGAKLADKISEIIESGHLRKIDHVCKGEEMEALEKFNNIWGVGPTTAQGWVQQGFRNLDDVQKKAVLNRQQKIGMKYYEEFLERMPREEVAEIQQIVTETAHEINTGYILTTCGSFRRGKLTCGDIDILVSHPDGRSHKGVLGKLLDALRLKHVLTDDLVRQEDNGEQRKYMGVCQLPVENAKHRRLDIIVSPWSEYHCALVHFTGSDHFNRSMRALAIKKGMSLSEHALRHGVIRHGKDKIYQGTPLPVHSEEDIFNHLGLEYRQPHERDY